jgi:signal transduction histidine kinase
MVKKIVNIYKGEIWLESKIEKGTTFYFTIKKEKLLKSFSYKKK